MYLRDYVSEDRVFCAIECMTKADLIGKMVDMVKESVPNLDKGIAVKNLLEKEGVFSTGVGGGIAIPHAVVPTVDKTYLAIAQLGCGIDYKSVDNEPVHVVFMLISPEGKTHEHIKLLARISRLCFRHEFVEKMKDSPNSKVLYEMIVAEDAKRHD
jgi:mannitol/fructose-specific phosphotransferase system IIA component (Ntr-type)